MYHTHRQKIVSSHYILRLTTITSFSSANAYVSGWNDGMTPHCQLYGITCNENGYVTKLNLKGNNVVRPGWYVFYYLLGDFTELKVFYQAILSKPS